MDLYLVSHGFEILRRESWGFVIKRQGIVHALVNTNVLAFFKDIPARWQMGSKHPYTILADRHDLLRVVA